MQLKSKVLLVGSGDRAALEVVRSLGKRKIQVFTIYLSERTLCEQSRYCQEGFFLGDPEKDYASFSQAFRNHFNDHHYDLVIPINDHANEIIFDHVDFLNKHSRIGAPSSEQYEFGHDKIKTGTLCDKLGVPYPETQVVKSLIDATNVKLTFPLFAKPQFSSQLKEGIFHNYHVRQLNSTNQLESFLRDNIATCNIMLQRKVNGYGVGVNVIAEKGKIISYGITKRLHEPPSGGNSSYRKSVPLDPILKEYSTKIIEALNWNGVAMLEFKFDGDKYYLMEINSRVWGSIGLSIYSGVDFPIMMYALHSEQNVMYNSNYRAGRYTRNLYRDIHWSLQQIGNKRVLLVLQEFILGSFRILTGKEKIDEFDWRDWWPFIKIQGQIINRYSRSVILKFVSKKKKFSRIGTLSIEREGRILFLCKGNINRSVFASEYLTVKHGIDASSAGTLKRRSRFASADAELVAKDFEVDLTGHRSQSIYDLNLTDFDQIIVFDDQNFDFMVNEFSGSLSKVKYLLDGSEIRDPYQQDRDFFKERFETIARQIDKLVNNVTITA